MGRPAAQVEADDDSATRAQDLHRITALTGATAIAAEHDPNGSRVEKVSAESQSYWYDADDHVGQVVLAITGSTVDLVYDYSGRQVLKTANGWDTVTRYYSDLAEVTGAQLTKHYFFAGMRIASQAVTAPTTMAAVAGDGLVQLASVHGLQPAVVLLLGRDAQRGLLCVMLVATTSLLLLPGRRRAVVGLALRRRPVLLMPRLDTVGLQSQVGRASSARNGRSVARFS